MPAFWEHASENSAKHLFAINLLAVDCVGPPNLLQRQGWGKLLKLGTFESVHSVLPEQQSHLILCELRP